MTKIEVLKLLLAIIFFIVLLGIYRIELSTSFHDKEYNYIKRNRLFGNLIKFFILIYMVISIPIAIGLIILNDDLIVGASQVWAVTFLGIYSVGLLQKKESKYYKKSIFAFVVLWGNILFILYAYYNLFYN